MAVIIHGVQLGGVGGNWKNIFFFPYRLAWIWTELRKRGKGKGKELGNRSYACILKWSSLMKITMYLGVVLTWNKPQHYANLARRKILWDSRRDENRASYYKKGPPCSSNDVEHKTKPTEKSEEATLETTPLPPPNSPAKRRTKMRWNKKYSRPLVTKSLRIWVKRVTRKKIKGEAREVIISSAFARASSH